MAETVAESNKSRLKIIFYSRKESILFHVNWSGRIIRRVDVYDSSLSMEYEQIT